MGSPGATEEHGYYCFETLYKAIDRKSTAKDAEFDHSAEYPLFVTWNKKSGNTYQLRGCIGNFNPLPLGDGLSDYALISAFKDSRFSPVSLTELPKLQCGVSLLTNFELCRNYLDWQVGVHGIYVELPNPDIMAYATLTPESASDSSAGPSTSPSNASLNSLEESEEESRPSYRSLSDLPPFIPPSGPNPRSLRKVLNATYLPDVIPGQGWDKTEAIISCISKAGYRGKVTPQILQSCRVTRYQSSKIHVTYDEWQSWRESI